MKAISFLIGCVFWANFAEAQSPLQSCIDTHQSCVKQCLSLEGDGSQAACVAQCAGSEAQCAGKIGIESSEPFLRKKAEQLEDLLNQFFEDILPVPETETETEPPRQTDT